MEDKAEDFDFDYLLIDTGNETGILHYRKWLNEGQGVKGTQARAA